MGWDSGYHYQGYYTRKQVVRDGLCLSCGYRPGSRNCKAICGRYDDKVDLVIDRFSFQVRVPRSTWEDTRALWAFLNRVWPRAVREAKGIPFDREPGIIATMKRKQGRDIPPFMDETGWDEIRVLVSGRAQRDAF